MPIVNPHRFAPAASNEEYVYGSCAPGGIRPPRIRTRSMIGSHICGTRHRTGLLSLPGNSSTTLGPTSGVIGRPSERLVRHVPVPTTDSSPKTASTTISCRSWLTPVRQKSGSSSLPGRHRPHRTGARRVAGESSRLRPRPGDRDVQARVGPRDAIEAGNATEAQLSDLLSSVARL